MSRPAFYSLFAALVVGMLAATALASAQRARRTAPQTTLRERPVVPRLRPLVRTPDAPPPSYEVVSVKPGRSVALRRRPDGDVIGSVSSLTQFGSPQALAVVAARGRWVGVTTSELPNGALAWIDGDSGALARRRTHISLLVELSRRLLELRAGNHVVSRISVGVGRAASPTPTGRFAITDKLSGADYGPYYGCCILALSGHQANTPPGWQGGDRLAIHGTDDSGSVGAAASAGCLHAGDSDMRLLMREVPVGTPVFIRR